MRASWPHLISLTPLFLLPSLSQSFPSWVSASPAPLSPTPHGRKRRRVRDTQVEEPCRGSRIPLFLQALGGKAPGRPGPLEPVGTMDFTWVPPVLPTPGCPRGRQGAWGSEAGPGVGHRHTCGLHADAVKRSHFQPRSICSFLFLSKHPTQLSFSHLLLS